MATTMDSPQASAASPGAGTYPIGRAVLTADWDGHAWTGQWHHDDSIAPPAAWQHRLLAFLRHGWFWYMVAGSALTVISGVITAATGQKYFSFHSPVWSGWPYSWSARICSLTVMSASGNSRTCATS